MRRFRLLIIAGLALAVLLIGVTVAYAGWKWNAALDVEGAEVRTAWEIVSDGDEDPGIYSAEIEVMLPEGASAEVIEQADNEEVSLDDDDDLECLANGIEAEVQYEVEATGNPQVNGVSVSVTANGQELGSAVGDLGEKIRVDVVIPGTCSSNDDDD